jgi:predicted metal-dependent phosphotriesterase family hydrolase
MSAAPVVRTVLGDVDTLSLGFCSSHDHVLIRDGLGARANPELLICDVDEASAEVAAFRAAGGRTLVDAMPLDCGRDPLGLVEVSRRTGVNIIATTGFHTPRYYERDHWSTTVDVDVIADLLTAEVVTGMDRHSYGGPHVERIEARAGLCKVASEQDTIGPVTRRLIDAVAECHRRTGVPVLTHMEHGTMGLAQVELLTGAGVPADAILLSHVDRNHDRSYHADLAASGAFLVYDGPSRSKYHSPQLVADLIGVACDAGGTKQVLLGMDLALRSYRVSCGGTPGMGFLPSVFPDVLRQRGHTDQAVEQFTVRNPAHALSLRCAA